MLKVDELADTKSIDINTHKIHGITGLISAVAQGYTNVVNAFLKHKDIQADARDNNRWNALKGVAALQDNLDIVEALIKHQVNKWIAEQKEKEQAEKEQLANERAEMTFLNGAASISTVPAV